MLGQQSPDDCRGEHDDARESRKNLGSGILCVGNNQSTEDEDNDGEQDTHSWSRFHELRSCFIFCFLGTNTTAGRPPVLRTEATIWAKETLVFIPLTLGNGLRLSSRDFELLFGFTKGGGGEL